METGVVPTVAQHVEEVMGKEGFRYVSAVVANCKMLALELEAQEGHQEPVDTEALIIAAYLHDISTVAYGFHEHHLKSAGLAVEFFPKLDMPAKLNCSSIYSATATLFTSAAWSLPWAPLLTLMTKPPTACGLPRFWES